jgi:hypothetical protein
MPAWSEARGGGADARERGERQDEHAAAAALPAEIHDEEQEDPRGQHQLGPEPGRARHAAQLAVELG